VRSARPHFDLFVSRNVDFARHAHSGDAIDDLVLVNHCHCRMVGEGTGQPVGRATLVADRQIDRTRRLADGWPSPGIRDPDIGRLWVAAGGEEKKAKDQAGTDHRARPRG
jgi:hypothetical protein